MLYLVDTNILLRLAKRDEPAYSLARGAAEALRAAGETLCYVPQNLVEFWNVSTRPAGNNGFGLTTMETDQNARAIETAFTLLVDNERVHGEWRRLVVKHSVRGVRVHDARLVAAMVAHGVTHILTFNEEDFIRYDNITVVHPRQVKR